MRNKFAFFIERVGGHFGFESILKSKSAKLRDMIRSPIHAVIDVGANDGFSAKWFLKVFPGAKAYSFEPLPEPFQKLSRWAKTQKGRVEVFNFALGEKEGELTCFLTTDYDKSSSFLKSTPECHKIYPFTVKQEPLKVRVRALDDVAAGFREDLTQGVLIKVDVQGYEEKVIRGGMQTFRNADACILEMNLDKLYEGQASFEGLLELLKSAGFSYAGNFEQAYAGDGHVIFVDAVFIRRAS